MNNVTIEELKGKVLTDIKVDRDKEIIFTCQTGEIYKMFHDQDCCEHVYIQDIIGYMDDLIGHEILEAYEESNSKEPPATDYAESFTWTFYRIRTMFGTVVIRWYGESNGYYSESVDFVQTKARTEPEVGMKQYLTTINNFLLAVDVNNKKKQEVQNWMADQALQCKIRRNGEAPVWGEYQDSVSALYVAEQDLISTLRELVTKL